MGSLQDSQPPLHLGVLKTVVVVTKSGVSFDNQNSSDSKIDELTAMMCKLTR